MPRTNSAAFAACATLGLLLAQAAALHLVDSGLVARIILPASLAAVPVALWAHRRNIGVWIAFVGLAANLAAIVANGGLMPIERHTVVSAVGAERAAAYTPGHWISGSKDVLLAPGQGHLRPLGDSIVVKIGNGGFVASPGDIVVWTGLVVFAVEVALASRRTSTGRDRSAGEAVGAARAEGGGVTQW